MPEGCWCVWSSALCRTFPAVSKVSMKHKRPCLWEIWQKCQRRPPWKDKNNDTIAQAMKQVSYSSPFIRQQSTLPSQLGNNSAIRLSSDLYYLYNLSDCDYTRVWHSESVCSGSGLMCPSVRKTEWRQRAGVWTHHRLFVCVVNTVETFQLNPGLSRKGQSQGFQNQPYFQIDLGTHKGF